MHFLVTCIDKADGAPLRRRTRAVHLEFMIAHQPLIVSGGPLRTDDGAATVGSAFIIDLPDRAAVEDFLRREPYMQAGLFDSVTVARIVLMTPEPSPGFLAAELARERAMASANG